MKIGCRADAKKALTFPDHYDYYSRPRRMKDGWRFVGAGARRCAYLSPAGVVYKIHKDGRKLPNKREYREVKYWQEFDLPAGWAVPDASLYKFKDKTVLAMEYIGGKHLEKQVRYYDDADNIWYPPTELEELFWDIHGRNVKRYKGVNYILDLER